MPILNPSGESSSEASIRPEALPGETILSVRIDSAAYSVEPAGAVGSVSGTVLTSPMPQDVFPATSLSYVTVCEAETASDCALPDIEAVTLDLQVGPTVRRQGFDALSAITMPPHITTATKRTFFILNLSFFTCFPTQPERIHYCPSAQQPLLSKSRLRFLSRKTDQALSAFRKGFHDTRP